MKRLYVTIGKALSCSVGLSLGIASGCNFALAQSEVPDDVLGLFEENCAFSGCHAGTKAPNGLDLSDEFALSSLVNQPSKDNPGVLRVKPGDPVNSYLIMKVRGNPAIDGEQMPLRSKPLSDADIEVLEAWVGSLSTALKAVDREYAEAFPGISLATLPTTQVLEPGSFSYRIAHRWRGPVDSGFAELFGLDAGARMLTQFDFTPANNLVVSLARTSENATFELVGKYRLLQQRNDGATPFSAALRLGVDWATRENLTGVNQSLSRRNSERFAWFAQLPLSKRLHERVSVLLVPGVLLNGNPQIDGEDALITLGFATKLTISGGLAIFVEGVPILSGAGDAEVVGGARTDEDELNFNDSFTIGLEQSVGGHVFHMYVMNSLGLTTNQYMSGGNFDFGEGDMRLGFNIYRRLGLP